MERYQVVQGNHRACGYDNYKEATEIADYLYDNGEGHYGVLDTEDGVTTIWEDWHYDDINSKGVRYNKKRID